MNTKKKRLTARLNLLMEPKMKRLLKQSAKMAGCDINTMARGIIAEWLVTYVKDASR